MSTASVTLRTLLAGFLFAGVCCAQNWVIGGGLGYGAYKNATTEMASTLINVQALKEFTSGKDYPPGIALPAEPGVGAFAH